MKYGIDCGHGCPPDTGASGCGQQEDKLTLAVGQRVTAKLQALEHEVVNCRPSVATSVNHSLAQRCAIANKADVDIFVSIHFNAFNGQAHGTEVFAISTEGKKLALPVLSEIVKLGFFNRGVKETGFYVLKNTSMTAILIECCFIDNQSDMNRFNVETMATAIVKGLTGKLPTPVTETMPVPNPRTDKWEQFISLLKQTEIQYPSLKCVQLGQAILESGRGTSKLFLNHNNAYGLKWRAEMKPIAVPVPYVAHDGQEMYCEFNNLQDAIEGYWVFINRSPYKGWEKFNQDPQKYLEFIVKAGYCPDFGYVNKVLALLPEANRLLQ